MARIGILNGVILEDAAWCLSPEAKIVDSNGTQLRAVQWVDDETNELFRYKLDEAGKLVGNATDGYETETVRCAAIVIDRDAKTITVTF